MAKEKGKGGKTGGKFRGEHAAPVTDARFSKMR
jgi:hypothetical protein